MSDEDPDADGRDRSDDGGREIPDEPLGGVAERVNERTGDAREGTDPDAPARTGPLADVATQVDERRRRDRGGSDAFESVDVGELDGEKLWERLADEDGEESSVSVPVGESVEVEDDVWGDDRDVRTIPKGTCHGCPNFGEPPELACTHEGTDILAMPDVDHFRVADCPMVIDEDEEISGLTPDPDEADQPDASARGEVADRSEPASEVPSQAAAVDGSADDAHNGADDAG
ncbi:hypothetical protein [Halorussus halobius]|uniref:hypothetical protein n=1 Tax=Halorussus halobius TaxID=1710537 RepID=UPI001B2FE838|nr:hypothetical protein [Halorussus halobius]